MTPDEIQRLMGSYATGSLTESERKLLFDAALEDQDLFDQLAHEQALKELIDQPGARDRLIAALAPAETSRASGGWKKPLAWGLAAMFVVSMSVAALMLTRAGDRREQAEKQITQKQVDDTQVARLNQPSATASGSVAPSISGSAPPPAKQARDRRSTSNEIGRGELDAGMRARPRAQTQTPPKSQTVDGQNIADDKLEPAQPAKENRRANSGAGSTSGSSAGSNNALKKTDALQKATASPATAPSPARPQTAGQVQTTGQIAQPPAVQAQGFVAGQVAPGQAVPGQAPQAPPAPLRPQGRQGTQAGTGQAENGRVQTAQSQVQAQTEQNQIQARQDQAQARGGGGGGGRGGSQVGRAAGIIGGVPATAPAHFAFDYSIDGEDLVFKFSADGYFSLHIAPGGLTIVDARVAAGSTRREHITGNGTEATIVFSASPESAVQGVSIDTRARSGTAEDPARKRIDLLMRFF